MKTLLLSVTPLTPEKALRIGAVESAETKRADMEFCMRVVNVLLSSAEAHRAFINNRPFRVYDTSGAVQWQRSHADVVKRYIDTGWIVQRVIGYGGEEPVPVEPARYDFFYPQEAKASTSDLCEEIGNG